MFSSRLNVWELRVPAQSGPTAAVLLAMIVPLALKVAANIPPPPSEPALLLLTVLSFRESVPAERLMPPPPKREAVFPLMVLVLTVNVPLSIAIPPPRVALFPLTVLVFSVNCPWVMKIPPPSPATKFPATVLVCQRQRSGGVYPPGPNVRVVAVNRAFCQSHGAADAVEDTATAHFSGIAGDRRALQR